MKGTSCPAARRRARLRIQWAGLLAAVSVLWACGGPDELVFFPNMTFTEAEHYSPDAGRLLGQHYAKHVTVYSGEFPKLVLLHPDTRRPLLLIQRRKVTVYFLGDHLVEIELRALHAVTPEEILRMEPPFRDAGFICQDTDRVGHDDLPPIRSSSLERLEHGDPCLGRTKWVTVAERECTVPGRSRALGTRLTVSCDDRGGAILLTYSFEYSGDHKWALAEYERVWGKIE